MLQSVLRFFSQGHKCCACFSENGRGRYLGLYCIAEESSSAIASVWEEKQIFTLVQIIVYLKKKVLDE